MPSVVLWGAGVMAGAHAASCQALGWKIVGVGSRTTATASALANTLRTEAMSYDALLDRDGVDLAIVSTPPADHAHAAAAWAERNIPTVVSTPLCQTLADADRLVEIEERASVPLLYASNLAAAPTVQAMFRRVADLGPVTSMSGRSLGPPPPWGGFTSGEWGGGALLHHGANQVALQLLLARLAGLGAPVNVSAQLGRAEHGSIEDHAELHLRFAGGLTTGLTVSWRGTDHSIVDLQLASDTGVLRLDMDPTPTLEHNGTPVPSALPRSTPAAAVPLAEVGLISQLMAFWADTEAGRRPVTNMAFGREVLDIVSAAYSSAGRSGQAVALPFSGPRELTPLELWTAAVD